MDWTTGMDYWTGVLDRAHAQKTNGSAISAHHRQYRLRTRDWKRGTGHGQRGFRFRSVIFAR